MALKRSVITGCSVFACFLFATFLHPATELYKMVEDKKGFFLDLEMIAAILKNFRKRLDAFIAARGSHFECD
ncbi:hypothetical protein QR680_016668 [Steinernema hermaphroditum]|uniref:Uncharacterized protein n=1 Tax=Steinernema hermaphroditum TaxID=289476 RepID=A0AA39HBY5_9BILA|nr:hypothetical protein QR680_016668 [Steinernema hermaphroditum]